MIPEREYRAAVAMLAACFAATPALAAPKTAATSVGYAVADIKLGMSPDEVATAARGKGLVLQDTSMTESFTEAVALATGRPVGTNTGVDLLVFRDTAGNRVSVKFAQMPGGARSRRVSFAVPKESYPTEDAAAEITRRYGHATSAGPSFGVYGTLSQWCAPAPKCTGAQPTLAVFSPGGDTHIVLEDGSMTAKAAAALQAAVKATPAAKRAAF